LVAQRLRRVLRHRASNVIEQGRRVRPIAADGAHGLCRGERALTADELVANAALPLVPVTGRALLLEDLAPVADSAASWWKAAAVTADIDIPSGDFRGRRDTADAVGTLRLHASRTETGAERERCDREATHWHW